jgi:hypothetical protein
LNHEPRIVCASEGQQAQRTVLIDFNRVGRTVDAIEDRERLLVFGGGVEIHGFRERFLTGDGARREHGSE